MMDPIQSAAGPAVGPAIRFDENAPHAGLGRAYTVILQLSILVFGASLAWFAFVYYPKVVDRYKNVPLPSTQKFGNVSANFSGFPIETQNFRVTYEAKPNSYYVFVEGEDLVAFVDNKNRAILALKSVLSVESVCKLNIFYVSSARLEIPDNLKVSPNCQ